MASVIELEITRGHARGDYRVQVVRSPAGEASGSFVLDCDELLARRSQVQDALLASSVRRRKVLSASEDAVRSVGVDLFKAVFASGEISSRLSASRALADERGESLRILMRVEAPELAALPWETMYDDDLGTYVCRREPLVRHVPVAAPPPPLRVTGSLRILAVVSAPRGLASLDVEAERANFTRALRHLIEPGAVHVEWVEDARWSVLQDVLLGGEWHVFHFIGHGDFDVERGEGVLALVGEDGRPSLVEASRVVDLLREARPMPRLVVLNSCSSGVASEDDLFSGTAAALVRGGVSAVAAMQFAISDGAAIEFCRGFYMAIARGRPLDEAVNSGRVAILGSSSYTLEWVTPIVYMRGPDGTLFAVDRVIDPKPEVLEAQVAAARRSVERGDPESAVVALDAVLAEDPDQDGASSLRELASTRARKGDVDSTREGSRVELSRPETTDADADAEQRLVLGDSVAQDESDLVEAGAGEGLPSGPDPRQPATPKTGAHQCEDGDAATSPTAVSSAEDGRTAKGASAVPFRGSKFPSAVAKLRQRRTAWVWFGLTAAGLVLAVTAWVVARASWSGNSDGHAPHSGGHRDTRLPESSMVLVRVSGEIRQLVALDVRSDKARVLEVDEKANRPALSPDRREVAYLLSDGNKPGRVRVAQIGQKPRDLLDESLKRKCPRSFRPAWSPDSQSLALICSDDAGNPRGIWVTNRAGTKIHRVLNSEFPAWFPTWGGDDRIYFIRQDPAGTTPDRIYWIPASGHGEPVRATDGDGYESNPDWGERGLLYVSSKREGQPGEMLLRTGGRTIHLTPRHHVDSATWSPDERSVAWLAPFSSSRVNGVWVAKFKNGGGGDPYLDDIRQVAFSGEPGVPSWRG